MYSKAVSASQLVKCPDSHAREPRSHLGGSSWLCEKNIAEFNEKERIFPSPPCAKRDESKAAVRGRKVAGPAVYKNIAMKFVPRTV